MTRHRSIERSHRIDAEEFYRLLDGMVINDVTAFNVKLQEWQDFYNFHARTAGSTARRPMRDFDRRLKLRLPRKRSTSAAHGLEIGGHRASSV